MQNLSLETTTLLYSEYNYKIVCFIRFTGPKLM